MLLQNQNRAAGPPRYDVQVPIDCKKQEWESGGRGDFNNYGSPVSFIGVMDDCYAVSRS